MYERIFKFKRLRVTNSSDLGPIKDVAPEASLREKATHCRGNSYYAHIVKDGRCYRLYLQRGRHSIAEPSYSWFKEVVECLKSLPDLESV